MGKLEINVDELKKVGEAISYSAERFSASLDNSIWEMSLHLNELIMLREYLSEYKVKVSGLSKEDYAKYARIAATYSNLKEFYSEVQRYRKERKLGIKTVGSDRFDINLSEEEAFQKYAGCSEEDAKKIADKMRVFEDDAIDMEALIRQHYTGNLAMQLGKNNGDYQNKAQEVTNSFETEVSPKIQEVADQYRPAMEKMGELIQKMNQHYASTGNGENNPAQEPENIEESGPRMGM